MTTAHVLVERDDDLGIVTMNRPERRNALSEAHLRELVATVEALADTPDVRAIVIAANGPVFSAGHDMREMLDHDADAMKTLLGLCATFMRKLQTVPLPVVAAVQGVATAAGCQLVASADLAVAADTARFATPGGSGGWFCTTPMVAVQRVLTPKRALELLFTGDPIDAATALAWGLVNRVVRRARARRGEGVGSPREPREPGAAALGKRLFHETGLDVTRPTHGRCPRWPRAPSTPTRASGCTRSWRSVRPSIRAAADLNPPPGAG
jgi:enoyl-CoA hydratase/carnithine racemase